MMSQQQRIRPNHNAGASRWYRRGTKPQSVAIAGAWDEHCVFRDTQLRFTFNLVLRLARRFLQTLAMNALP